MIKPRRAFSAFWVPFFVKKGTGVQGQSPWSLTAVSEIPLSLKEAQEWVNFWHSQKEGEPSPGVLPSLCFTYPGNPRVG